MQANFDIQYLIILYYLPLISLFYASERTICIGFYFFFYRTSFEMCGEHYILAVFRVSTIISHFLNYICPNMFVNSAKVYVTCLILCVKL